MEQSHTPQEYCQHRPFELEDPNKRLTIKYVQSHVLRHDNCIGAVVLHIG